jgi:AcrR family transcriptional regulator
VAIPMRRAARQRQPRRSQAERSAETRKKVIEAVISLVAEEGFARATSSRIAKRAGVTWGAVQHHFGAKADILESVLDESLEHFERHMDVLVVEGRSLEQRVSDFIDRSWEHYRSAHYRAVLEIILNSRGDADPERHEHHRALADAVDRLWTRILAEERIDVARRRLAEAFAFSALTGLAVQSMIQHGDDGIRDELEVLKQTLLRLLAPTPR